MNETTWRAFPLHVIQDERGNWAVLPTERDVESLLEAARECASRLAELRAELAAAEEAPPPIDGAPGTRRRGASLIRAEIDGIAMRQEAIEAQAEAARRLLEEYGPRAQARPYEVRPATFEEYLLAEEDARDYVNERPVVSDQRHMLNLMVGRIRLGDRALTRREVGSLEPPVARKLHGRILELSNPNPAQVPFWRSHWRAPTE